MRIVTSMMIARSQLWRPRISQAAANAVPPTKIIPGLHSVG